MEAKAKIEQLGVVAKGVMLPMGLRVDEVHLAANKLELSDQEPYLALSQAGDLVARIGFLSLTTFLSGQLPDKLTDLSLENEGGLLLVRANLKVLVKVPVEARCSLEIREGLEIWVKLESVRAAGASPQSLVQGILDKHNPIFKLSDLPVSGSIVSTRISDSGVEVRARVSPAF